MRLLGRSYMAFVLAPNAPCMEWLSEIDEWLSTSPGFFGRSPVVLDLAAVKLSRSGVAHLVAELESRGIRIMGFENADPAELDSGLPPLLAGGRACVAGTARAEKKPATLFLDSPVRSGQSIYYPDGDVTVLGSVGSGAEVVAGGSIYVYGTLRGRAMAGSNGNRRARIFCTKIQAELVAIDGYYVTAESIAPALSGRPVQAWLDNETVRIAHLD